MTLNIDDGDDDDYNDSVERTNELLSLSLVLYGLYDFVMISVLDLGK